MSEGPPFFHVGILVFDLEAAIDHFSAVMGLSFGPPETVHLSDIVDADGRVSEVDLRLIYSNEGPPFVELIEAVGEGVWGVHNGEGLHHIGCWQQGFAERLEELGHRGGTAEVAIPLAGEVVAAYLPPAMLHNTRVELVCPMNERQAPA